MKQWTCMGRWRWQHFFDENEILRATSDEYRNEIHSKFPDVLVPATGAALEDADVHPVSVQYALSQWKSLSAFVEVFNSSRIWGLTRWLTKRSRLTNVENS